jgi:hypothetical protein
MKNNLLITFKNLQMTYKQIIFFTSTKLNVTGIIFLSFLLFSLSSFLMVDNSVQKKDVPFKASFKTQIQIMGTPPIQPVRSFGQGIASHLGRSEFDANSTVNFTVQPAQINGTATITAANGDSFTTSFSGTTSLNGDGTATGHFTHTITGGTGRFSDISGTLNGVSLHNMSTNIGTLDLYGSINY